MPMWGEEENIVTQRPNYIWVFTASANHNLEVSILPASSDPCSDNTEIVYKKP